MCLVFLSTDKETETQKGGVTYLGPSGGKWQSPGGDLRQKVFQVQCDIAKPLKRKGAGKAGELRTEGEQ